MNMTQEFEMYDVVKLKSDRPADRLKAGVIGTIVMKYGERAYEVEFVDDEGATLAVLTMPPDELELVQSAQ